MADDLRTELDEFLPQFGRRPVYERLRCCQGAQEVAEIVSESVKLETDRRCCDNPEGRRMLYDWLAATGRSYQFKVGSHS